MAEMRFPEKVYRGLTCMVQGEYFEAHEWLEEAWREEPGPIRELYQGLLQAAVVAYHVQQGNYRGAYKVYRRAMRHLVGWPDVVRGLKVEALRQDLHALAREIEAALQGSPPERWTWPVPQWEASEADAEPQGE